MLVDNITMADQYHVTRYCGLVVNHQFPKVEGRRVTLVFGGAWSRGNWSQCRGEHPKSFAKLAICYLKEPSNLDRTGTTEESR